jgi:serine/threonine-protein kinase HipA
MSQPSHFRNFLYVYQKHQLIGYLNFQGGYYEFAYDSDYLCQDEAGPLSPELILTDAVFSSERLFNVFEQVIPEGVDRNILENQADSANDFDLLPLLKNIYGDLAFFQTKPKWEEIEKYRSPRYVEVKTEILSENTFPNVLNLDIKIDEKTLFPPNLLPAKHFRPSGLSGFQHKFSVVMNHKLIRLPEKNEACQYFMKPYSPARANPESEYYLPHLAINEHLFMTFAKNELGFDVPWSGIVKNPADSEYHYIVKRYDRYKGYKFSCHEFATLVGLVSETKYQMSSEQLFKNIKQYLTLKTERLKLLKYYFYSMVIAHEDMHTKNLSVLKEDKKFLMSPLYDIATTAVYQGASARETALLINGKNKNIRPADFYQLVELLEVDRRDFNKAATEILLKYRHQLPHYFTQLEKLPEEMRFYERSRVHSPNRKLRITKSLQFVNRLRRKHQARLKQLEKAGWYELM